MDTFQEGDRVHIPPDDDNPAETGVVVGLSGMDVYVVQLDPEYYDPLEDDGLREIDATTTPLTRFT